MVLGYRVGDFRVLGFRFFGFVEGYDFSPEAVQ